MSLMTIVFIFCQPFLVALFVHATSQMRVRPPARAGTQLTAAVLSQASLLTGQAGELEAVLVRQGEVRAFTVAETDAAPAGEVRHTSLSRLVSPSYRALRSGTSRILPNFPAM